MFSCLENEDFWNVSDGNMTWASGASASVWSAELGFAPQPPHALLWAADDAEFNFRLRTLRQHGLFITNEEIVCCLCCLLACALRVQVHKQNQQCSTIGNDEQQGCVLSTCTTPGMRASCQVWYCFPTAGMALKQH